MKLTPQQTRALDLILMGPDGTQIGGFAGTGKTTVLAEAARRDPTIIFAAPTNKAAMVMRSKMPRHTDVRTFHKITQKPVIDNTGKLVGFEPAERLRHGARVVVDEASMIGQRTWDVGSYALEYADVVLVGDPAQLPPVNDTPIFGGVFDLVLTDIHRQAQGNPVLDLATRIRTTAKFSPEWLDEFGIEQIDGAKLKRDREALSAIWHGEAQYLCFTNLDRVKANRMTRASMGDHTPTPAEQDVLLFYGRDHADRWHNGSTAVIEDVVESLNGAHNVSALIDGSDFADEITLYEPVLDASNVGQAYEALPEDTRHNFAMASYGYAMTVHKAQGSEWPTVYLKGNNKPRGSDGVKWLYTAITRAQDNLIWVG